MHTPDQTHKERLYLLERVVRTLSLAMERECIDMRNIPAM